MNGSTLVDFKRETAIHCHYKAWKSQDIFLYNADCIRLKEESHIHLGWLEGMAKLSAAEKQRLYRQRRDADPECRAEYLQKRKESYARDIDTKKRTRKSDLSEREKRSERKAWRVRQQRVRAGAFSTVTWNFFEASHGKGSPDGVGAALKRTADTLVHQGKDIPDAQSFFQLLKDTSKVKLFYVSEEEVDKNDEGLRKVTLVDMDAINQTGKYFRPNVIKQHHSGQWCFVLYDDDDAYPGIILQMEDNNVRVKCMHRNGVNTFFWPSPRDDVNWYGDDQIICLISEPLALNKRSVQIDQWFWGFIMGQLGK